MKTTTLILIFFLTGLDLWGQNSPAMHRLPPRLNNNAASPASPPAMPNAPAPAAPPNMNTPATQANNAPAEEMIPAGTINFQGVDVDQVLDVYSQLVGRTVLRAGLPAAQIVLKTETPLTKTEAIQALQAVLELNGVSLINMGDKFVKAVPAADAGTAGGAFSHATANQLPDLGSFVTRVVQLKYIDPSDMLKIISPFAKLQNSIIPIDSNGILVLRDYAENVKRMMEMINQVDVNVPDHYVSEVIPIKYAMVDDIASALGSLGGSTSTMGSAPTPSSHTTGGGGFNNGAQNGSTPQNQVSPMALSQGSGNSFSSRLQQIISRAATGGGENQIQIFGQTKIIADERSNSLLVFATPQDMATIKNIVSKLDVLLSQVLIESVIMDVSLNSGWNFGVSAAQNPKTFSGNSTNLIQNILGAGGLNNGAPFYDFLNSALGTNGASSSGFGNSLSSGLSYFGNIGPTWDVALQAAAEDGSVTVVQRPRIQTSQAKEASFFVGETVPYVTSYGGGSIYGNSSTYSQLSVGVELDVTPFINPDGLVVMDINQEIDDLDGSTAIEGIGNVPNTDKRTLSSEIAVRSGDTVLLGGFIRNERDKTRTGIPLLQDIPLLGALFRSDSSTKTREELLVLMRPTVLKTPELAAAQTRLEEARLPGISHAIAEDAADENQQIKAEKKMDRKFYENETNSANLFQSPAPGGTIDNNNGAQPNF